MFGPMAEKLSLDWVVPLSLRAMISDSRCPWNCSGHGICEDGQCVCLVQFTGGSCSDANTGYYIAFGTIFVCLSLVAFVQLCLCARTDYIRDDKRSFKSVWRLTTQKVLYLLVICATTLRAIYFFCKWHVSESVASGLWTAYFPVMLTGFSLIVCFWAEAFHLNSIACDKPRFLSKSMIGFTIFNVFIYMMLLTRILVTDLATDNELSNWIERVCNGSFAVLMLICVTFFLIYGVEVYFKIHGAFTESHSNVDLWQLHMSRLGLVAQAMLQLITALFLVSDVTREVWEDKLPVLSLNFYDIGFRIVEFGVALWFPCVLWNCQQPEQLWVLNPQRIFKSFNFPDLNGRLQGQREGEHALNDQQYPNYGSISDENGLLCRKYRSPQSGASFTAEASKQDCWICYDVERTDAGALIQPCQCKGDMATVHHECLRKWLMECAESEKALKCKVCDQKYELVQRWPWVPHGLKSRHWFQTFLVLTLVVGCPFAAYVVVDTFAQTHIKIIAIGGTLLVELASFRFLGKSLVTFYQQGRLGSVKILGRIIPFTQQTEHKVVDSAVSHIIKEQSIPVHTLGTAVRVEAIMEHSHI